VSGKAVVPPLPNSSGLFWAQITADRVALLSGCLSPALPIGLAKSLSLNVSWTALRSPTQSSLIDPKAVGRSA